MSANGDGNDALAQEEFSLLLIAMGEARRQTEMGESMIGWGAPVLRFIHAVAEQEAEKVPPLLREPVEQAVVRGVAYALSTSLKLWFSPELAR